MTVAEAGKISSWDSVPQSQISWEDAHRNYSQFILILGHLWYSNTLTHWRNRTAERKQWQTSLFRKEFFLPTYTYLFAIYAIQRNYNICIATSSEDGVKIETERDRVLFVIFPNGKTYGSVETFMFLERLCGLLWRILMFPFVAAYIATGWGSFWTNITHRTSCEPPPRPRDFFLTKGRQSFFASLYLYGHRTAFTST